MTVRYCVVGAGFSGAIIANFLASKGFIVDVYESRNHVAGNCFTEIDQESGILVHKYGPHIFHTDDKKIWDYVNSLAVFDPYINRVKARVQGKIYSLPINLHTINQFFSKAFSPEEARVFIESLSSKSASPPQSFEDQALQFIGPELYNSFFKGYTIKQWGVKPNLLPASILKRLPVRFTYDDNYFSHQFQGIPRNGYTPIVEKLLDNPRIQLRLNSDFNKLASINDFEHLFFTGPIDSFFNYRNGRLPYRSLRFEEIRSDQDIQGCAVMNYCDENIPFTRITEHKYFSNSANTYAKSIAYKEYSLACDVGDDPYYPIRFAGNTELIDSYYDLALRQSKVSFLGRLGTFRYLDMDKIISEAIEATKYIAKCLENGSPFPVFFSSF